MISVIIPTYNRSTLIARAIESVLTQTYTDIEIIVVDDGSTDGTERVLMKYVEQVMYLRLSHGGLPAISRNEGLRIARGEFIAFLDDDDTWHPEKLQRQMEYLLKMNAQAICCNAYRIKAGYPTELFFSSSGNRLLMLDELLMDNKLITSSVVLHRSIIDKIGRFPESPKLKAVEDYAYWLRAAALTPVYYLDEPLVNYADNPGQSVRSQSINEFSPVRRVLVDFAVWCLGKIWMPRIWYAFCLLVLQYGRREYFWYRARRRDIS